MNQSSEGCMKMIGSVNIDKLINDFSQIEKVCKVSQWLLYIQESRTDFTNERSGEKKNVPKK
jgi:hypothetical protein